MERSTYKKIQNLLLFFTISVLGLVLLIEYKNSLEPCPLCIMQRMCAFIVGFLSFVGLSMISIRKVRIVTVLQIVFAIFGLYFAFRQLWIQITPVENGQMCMPGLDVVKQYVNRGLFKTYFLGAVDCSEVTWRGLGLSMPAWASLYFTAIIVANVSVFVLLKQKINQLAK